MHWSQMALASLTDAMMQFGMVLLLLAVGIAGVVIWLTLRRWGPALHQLSAIVDREMHDAGRSAEGLQQNAQAQMKRVYRQAASVRSALDGVKSLHSLTVDLDQRAHDLRQLAHHMSTESSLHGGATDDFAHYAISSAEHLAETAERARHTYRKLLTSVNQLVTDGDSLREGEEMERQARALTGAVERVRLAVHDRRVLAPNASAKPAVAHHGKEQPNGARWTTPRAPWSDRAEQRQHGTPADGDMRREESLRHRDNRLEHNEGLDGPLDSVVHPARGRAEPEMGSQPGAGRLTRNRATPRDPYADAPEASARDWEDRGPHHRRPSRMRDRDDERWRDDDDASPRRRSMQRRPYAGDERDWRR